MINLYYVNQDRDFLICIARWHVFLSFFLSFIPTYLTLVLVKGFCLGLDYIFFGYNNCLHSYSVI